MEFEYIVSEYVVPGSAFGGRVGQTRCSLNGVNTPYAMPDIKLLHHRATGYLVWQSSAITYHCHMSWVCQCASVIPCFNEAKHISSVVGQLQAFLPNVIVVDDGSTDATASEAGAAGAEVIRHRANRGKGTALQTGWDRSPANADSPGRSCSTATASMRRRRHTRFFRCAENTNAPLVVGNRLHQPQAMPWLRRQVNRWMTKRLSRLTGWPLADSQCGFRLVHLETLARLSLAAGDHFEIESEMLVAFLRAGQAVEFVPVQVIYHSGGSKIRALPDSWRWFRWWLAAQCASRNRVTPLLPPIPPFPAASAGESRA